MSITIFASNTQSFRLFWDIISEMMCQDLTLICKTYFLVEINDRFVLYFLNSRVCLFDLEFFLSHITLSIIDPGTCHFFMIVRNWSFVIITDTLGWKTCSKEPQWTSPDCPQGLPRTVYPITFSQSCYSQSLATIMLVTFWCWWRTVGYRITILVTSFGG